MISLTSQRSEVDAGFVAGELRTQRAQPLVRSDLGETQTRAPLICWSMIE